MSNLKISELPAATELSDEELVPVVQDGETRKATVTELVEATDADGDEIVNAKRNNVASWMDRQRGIAYANGFLLPIHTVTGVLFSETTPHTMTSAVAIKAYNGAWRAPDGFVDNDGPVPGFILDPQGSDHYCFLEK
ncbi:MAG: hypothetical protein LBK71_07630 [Verrucomicrobiales bacterium]|jgi:hypothetical protein|nr:hypothetical protein [Verrucomicrobiales bacterium]